MLAFGFRKRSGVFSHRTESDRRDRRTSIYSSFPTRRESLVRVFPSTFYYSSLRAFAHGQQGEYHIQRRAFAASCHVEVGRHADDGPPTGRHRTSSEWSYSGKARFVVVCPRICNIKRCSSCGAYSVAAAASPGQKNDINGSTHPAGVPLGTRIVAWQ